MTVLELGELAAHLYGDMVKGVVDVDRGLVAVDAELHSDLEACLLADGSRQASLWGVNFYPEISGDGFVEYDSLINIRPAQGNRSRTVESEPVRLRILDVISKRIVP